LLVTVPLMEAENAARGVTRMRRAAPVPRIGFMTMLPF
jgi:hypothetical protein